MANMMEVKSGLEICTTDFWYDLTDGGYIKPEEILKNSEDVMAVDNAIAVLRKFKNACIRGIPDFIQ